jgi:hypothetical protein
MYLLRDDSSISTEEIDGNIIDGGAGLITLLFLDYTTGKLSKQRSSSGSRICSAGN